MSDSSWDDDHLHSKALPDLVVKLLGERRQLLALHSELAKLSPYSSANQIEIVALLRRFCQVLMDYMSLGHFEVFEALENEAISTEHAREFARLMQQSYPTLEASTQQALDFNERFDQLGDDIVRHRLAESLENLAQQLARRIEIEDVLIRAAVH